MGSAGHVPVVTDGSLSSAVTRLASYYTLPPLPTQHSRDDRAEIGEIAVDKAVLLGGTSWKKTEPAGVMRAVATAPVSAASFASCRLRIWQTRAVDSRASGTA